MITREDIKVTEITEGKFEASHLEWKTTGNLRRINRRIEAYIKQQNEFETAEIKAEEIKNAPKKTCPRCQGRGYIDAYLHVAHGVCYKCGGSGKVVIKTEKSRLCLKENSKGNWKALFSKGFM